MHIKSALAIALLGTLFVLPVESEARTGKFSCPIGKGVTCMSAENVYEATNHVDYLEPEETGRRSRQRNNRRRSRQAEPVQPVYAPPPQVAPQVVAVPGSEVPTPDRCCDPVATAVTVKGDTLAVSSPVPTQAAVQAVQPQAVSSTVTSTSPNVVLPGGGGETVLRTTNNEAFRTPARVMRILVHPWIDDSGDLNMGGYVLTEIEPRRWSVGSNVSATDHGYRLLLGSPARETAQDARTAPGSATPSAGRTERNVANSNSPEKSQ